VAAPGEVGLNATSIDNGHLIYAEWCFQRQLLRALLNAAKRGELKTPRPIQNCWRRLEALALASVVADQLISTRV
jgi:hypothetical protein